MSIHPSVRQAPSAQRATSAAAGGAISYLKRLPVDKLKIDGSFVAGTIDLRPG